MRYIHPLNRETMFNYSQVHCRSNATEDIVLTCYECKLNNNEDLVLESLSLDERITHMEGHIKAGHLSESHFQIKSLRLQREIRDRSVTSVTVHYAISNNGDGSASVMWAKTPEDAEKYDSEMDEGWGEPLNTTKTLHFDKDGVLINANIPEEE